MCHMTTCKIPDHLNICCRTDLVSGVLRRKIAVVYADASQTDLEVVGEVCFPNLQFDVAAVGFGSVLNDTTARQQVVMTNTSQVDAAFRWQFTDADASGDGMLQTPLLVCSFPNSSQLLMQAASLAFTLLLSAVRPGKCAGCLFCFRQTCWAVLLLRICMTELCIMSISCVTLHHAERPDSSASNHARIAVGASAFDILPTQGVLKAGQTCTIEFAYYARPGQKASTTAVCEVEGGPTYTLPVSADSNAIKYMSWSSCMAFDHLHIQLPLYWFAWSV